MQIIYTANFAVIVITICYLSYRWQNRNLYRNLLSLNKIAIYRPSGAYSVAQVIANHVYGIQTL